MSTTVNTHVDGEDFAGTIGNTREESSPSWPVPPAPPADSPNVVFIVLDDVGYAQLGCYGGLADRIRTPHLDALAAGGLRYRNFHTTALCGPTRAALLTGMNHHSVGMGTIASRATGFPGYHARIPRESAMVPRVLGDAGYATYCVGKWHLTPDEHHGPTGPFDRWPIGQGFDRFYGFLTGKTDQWAPELWEDNHRVDPPGNDDYHLTSDLADKAITWLDEHRAVDPHRPFMLHFATGAAHSPHHAPKEYIDRYAGRFDDGWDVIRNETFARQLELGVVPDGTTLPPRNRGVRAWDSLSETERRVYCRQMEVYAAFVEHTDDQVGRLIEQLRSNGAFDNTLVFVLSDNGASAEGGAHGMSSDIRYMSGQRETVEEMVDKLDEWGGPTTQPHYAAGWASAGSTPQKWYKSFVHEGGTRDPLIVSWPARIAETGGIRDQFHHVVDIAATIFDLTGIERPAQVDGVEQRPLEGTSFAYSFEQPDEPTHKRRQYFEMFAHRAIWSDGWKAVTMHPAPGAAIRIGDPELETRLGGFDEDVWELYHLAEDFSEAHDLAGSHPEKLAELQALWWEDAHRFNVLPLDDRLFERSQEPKPHVVRTRDVYRFTSPIRLVRPVSPSVIDRDHHIRATIVVPDHGCEGVIISNGGRQGGYTLCVVDGCLTYASNYLGHEHTVVAAPDPLPTGRVEIAMEWSRTSAFAGDVALFVSGRQVADGHVPETNPVIYAVTQGLEVGSDAGTPVWPAYESPFRFTGGLVEVVLSTEGSVHVDAEAEDRIARFVQ